VIFKSNSDFIGLPTTEQTTDKNGQITVTALTATASGTLSIEAAVNGARVSASLTVNAATYSLEASPNTLTLGVETEVTFTLQANGNPLGDTAVTLSGENLTFSSTGATTDKDGKFTVKLTPTGSGGNRTISATVGTDTVPVDLSVSKVTFVLTDSGGGKDTSFVGDKYQTIKLTATLVIDGKEVSLDGTPVTWTVESSSVSCEAWMRSAGAYNGLMWGQTPLSLTAAENDKYAPAGTAPTGAEAYLTDIVGERTVTVKASVEYNGQLYTAEEKTVTFGNGPLSVFEKPLRYMTWKEAAQKCGSLPSDSSPGYHDETNLPRKEELQAVSGPGNGGYGAAFAAKWPDDPNDYDWFRYWTGELLVFGSARIVGLHDGNVDGYSLVAGVLMAAVCRRRG
ncbi:hypothetical protein, partial [uncultured Desulfovibrio sp.]|uniref:hypothetical protein n=1 Tax=uncultured Desulfovibrio sp. TaxID=167968 RepID=UPI002631C8DD